MHEPVRPHSQNCKQLFIMGISHYLQRTANCTISLPLTHSTQTRVFFSMPEKNCDFMKFLFQS